MYGVEESRNKDESPHRVQSSLRYHVQLALPAQPVPGARRLQKIPRKAFQNVTTPWGTRLEAATLAQVKGKYRMLISKREQSKSTQKGSFQEPKESCHTSNLARKSYSITSHFVVYKSMTMSRPEPREGESDSISWWGWSRPQCKKACKMEDIIANTFVKYTITLIFLHGIYSVYYNSLSTFLYSPPDGQIIEWLNANTCLSLPLILLMAVVWENENTYLKIKGKQ